MLPDNSCNDYRRGINNIRKIAPITVNHDLIWKNIDFILSHFKNQHELFPRTIMTRATSVQKRIEIESNKNVKEKIFDYFEKSNFVDCRINAYPYNSSYTRINLDVKNRTAANFIMIDLDLDHFEDTCILDKHLSKILTKLNKKFNKEAFPTVLWTGKGYHIYQPIDGIIFDQHQQFYDFLPYLDGKDLTTEFIRFAEKYFSDGKADPKHLPSINSCLIRIPETLNSKNMERVRIVQKWDGNAPNIRWIVSDFFDYLIDLRNEVIEEKKRSAKLKPSISSFTGSSTVKIDWIERLIETPIEDYRKYCLWSILCPYLINVRCFTYDEAYQILDKWLCNCDQLKKIDFSPLIYIKAGLKGVKTYWPPKIDTLKRKLPELYEELGSKNITK
jgi:hypothetical protein